MPRVPAIVLIAVLSAGPAHALQVTRSITLTAAPKSVWHVIGGFCSIDDWHPGVKKCVLDQGAKPKRTLTLANGETLVEQQDAFDETRMRYTYSIVQSPLPVSNYSSTLSVTPDGSGSKVTWTGTFGAKNVPDAEAEKAVGDIYDSGLKALTADPP